MASEYTTTGVLSMDNASSAYGGDYFTPPYYAKFLRENLYTSLYMRQLGTLVTIPKGHKDKVKISRWKPSLVQHQGQTSAIKALTAVGMMAEGTVLDVGVMSADALTGTVTGWSGGKGYTDKTVIVSMTDFMEGALELLARESAWRVDNYVRKQISANAFAVYAEDKAAGAGSAGAVGSDHTLHSKNLAKIAPLMGAMGVPRWDDGTYVGVCHELAQYDMLMDTSATGFVPVARYNDARMIYRGEMGEFYGVRWLMSNSSAQRIWGTAALTAVNGLSATASGSNAFVFSPDSFYLIEQEGAGVQVIHQPLGSAGTADAAAQLGSIAIKFWMGAAPTPAAEYRIMRLVHGMSLHY